MPLAFLGIKLLRVTGRSCAVWRYERAIGCRESLLSALAAHPVHMRVTFVLPGVGRRPVGGYGVVYQYASRLAARGHAITVLHARLPVRPGGSLGRCARDWVGRGRDWMCGARPRWFPLDSRVRVGLLPSFDSVRLPEAEAVFATAWQTAPLVAAAPPRCGEKFYLIQHYETWSGSQHEVDATWRLPLHKIAVSRWLLDVGRRLGAGEIDYLTNAIDHRAFRLIRRPEGRAARVAMMYSDLAFKGARYGIRALESARSVLPDLQAVLFGTTARPKGLPAWIEYYRDPSREALIRNIYNSCSVYLAANLAEGWSLPPAEAACCGCAIVGSDSGGIREYVEHGRSGLLSQPADWEALSRDLCRVLADEPLRLRLAAAARQRLLALDWDRNTERLELLLLAHCAAESR